MKNKMQRIVYINEELSDEEKKLHVRFSEAMGRALKLGKPQFRVLSSLKVPQTVEM